MEGLHLIAAHFAADWLLQTDRMASEKFENRTVRFQHVAIYTAVVTATAAFLTTWSALTVVIFAVLIGVPHYVIDSRRWKDPVDGFPTRALWFDQAYHLITLAIAAGIGGWVS